MHGRNKVVSFSSFTFRESLRWINPYLHADDGIDKEEHGDEETDVGQGLEKKDMSRRLVSITHHDPDLERLDKGPEQDSDCVALSQELDQPGSPEESQESHIDKVFLQVSHHFGLCVPWDTRWNLPQTPPLGHQRCFRPR